MVLRRAGAEVRVVSSAFRAHELVTDSWLPKSLLTDLAMPGEDGFMLAGDADDLHRTARRVDHRGDRVRNAGEERPAILAGFDLYLTKPIDPLDFAAAVAGLALRVT